jgi:uronate dehydrogenase
VGVRVLVTGASGRIGAAFVASEDAADLDVVATDLEPRHPGVTELDVRDAGACQRAVAGVDAVLHLAADPHPFADLLAAVLPLNVVGTYHVLAAAEAAGVSRFVWASSIWAVAGYPGDHLVLESDAPRPGSHYGVGKAACEALCAAHATWSATTSVSVRIGAFGDRPASGAAAREQRAWLSRRDANQLLRLALTAPIDGHEVVHGVSDNTRPLLSLERTRTLLGYTPRDRGGPRS